MSGNSQIAWACLVAGMLLQLTYMIVPLQRWDWARFLGAGALPLFALVKASNDNLVATPRDGLELCGIFTFAFALIFQQRLLPRLGEGIILTWTAVFLCVIVEFGAWQSQATYLGLGAGLVGACPAGCPARFSYVLKLGVYAWFLLVVVVLLFPPPENKVSRLW